ncbi:energy transducer TonB [Sphingopyxis sp. H115]|uniref:energy transducer TonB family protein n=1 Tax=Sphingopyxis sp. H115 TaxID=1759073 RepID=UPI0009E7996A|nr:energy transducer TonB [Sphingopyxis sp. H115]
MKRNSIRVKASLLAAMLSASVVPDDALAVEADPQGGWEVDYGKASCRLIRHLGAAAPGHRIEIERNWAFDGYRWALLGPTVHTLGAARSVDVALGAEPPRRFKAWGENEIRWHDEEGRLFAALQKSDRIGLTSPKRFEITASLPKTVEAVRALEACEDDLMKNWGVDASQFRALLTTPQPVGQFGRWVTNDDITRDDVANRREGNVTFLLRVDATGKVTGCRPIESSGHAILDTRTCVLLLKRASFKPARDAAGQNVPSFYINRTMWQLPR